MEQSQPAELEDEELVSLAQSGDREAFEVLVERYKQKAYHIAFGFTRDREEAKDLSQDAFLRAFTHLKGFNLRASFYTWFYRILVNLCLDYRRRRGRILWDSLDGNAERFEPGDPSNSPDQAAIAKEMSRKVGLAVEALPPKQRTAFILKNHQGLSIHEIAKVMQSAEGTVKVHIHRAVVALQQSLGELV
ncbi:MAG: RNA polymerase sigma factor [Candidatus Binatia bacterium]